MSVSGVNSTINANPQVQQQKSKSKAKAPLYGVGAGAGIAAVANYHSAKSNMKHTLELIDSEKHFIRATELDLLSAINDVQKNYYENSIKGSKQRIENYNAKLPELKKAVKPMGILKSVAKTPLTYILAATGLVVGLCVNHKNKSAKQ